MNDVTQIIDRVKNLKQFTVLRDIQEITFNGLIPFDIQHTSGELARITVLAVSQQEAELKVSRWINQENID